MDVRLHLMSSWNVINSKLFDKYMAILDTSYVIRHITKGVLVQMEENREIYEYIIRY